MDAQGFIDLALGLPDAVVVIDASAQVVWANPATERLIGMKLEDVLGTCAFDLVHPEDREPAVVSLVRVQRNEAGTLNEFRVRTANGWKRVELN
jgi:PAS domain S-box-containing protein